MVVGWYHSHPGFGCWLSGVDINTQQSFEALNARAVAVVVDPVQSVKVGAQGEVSGGQGCRAGCSKGLVQSPLYRSTPNCLSLPPSPSPPRLPAGQGGD